MNYKDLREMQENILRTISLAEKHWSLSADPHAWYLSALIKHLTSADEVLQRLFTLKNEEEI